MFNIDQNIAFSIAVVDAEGDVTTTTAVDPPAFVTWATPTFTNNTGMAVGDAGEHTIAMKVCDVWGACTEESFLLVINQKPYVNTAIPNV